MNSMNFIIASEKKWNKNLVGKLNQDTPFTWESINKKEDLSIDHLKKINPQKIFFPHWSHIIPKEIYNRFECVVFHMTDLPYGRGGSPLQNLIVRGHKSTKVSALKVGDGIDTGDIYLKSPLSLEGTAKEIFERANDIISEQILTIVNKELVPKQQTGEPTIFKRRTPEESNISELNEVEDIYDYIRMLDAEGYPMAFIETKNFKFEFNAVEKVDNNSLTANVRIIKK